MRTTPGRITVGRSGVAVSGPGNGGSDSAGWAGRTGRSSVPPKIVRVAVSGAGQIIGQ